MAIELYPHNQTAYENAVRMMEEHGKAAVIHPTGTGKSFIAFKLAEDNPGACIVWLAPSEYIFRSQRENYLEAGGEPGALSGIVFRTYAKLMYSMADAGYDAEPVDDAETDEGDAGRKEAVTEEAVGTGAGGAGRKEAGIKVAVEPDDGDVVQKEAGIVTAVGEDAGDGRTPDGAGLQGLGNPDYIVLDEFHRCGAEGWGRGVELLLRAYPDAKVLGLSATHIRYLDNRRDMARELFDGRIASRMELAEAVSAGILPAPLYICGLYEYRDELRKLAHRVENQRNAGVRDAGVKLLEKLRRCLQQADGPREIFTRHMRRDGKYIVFCSGREHMEEMISLAGTWYGALDREPSVYRAIYDNRESPEEVRRFQEDRSSHLKLLFCIDMLNEGIHVADVDGAVLLRPTASPTLYLQQVGRALSVPGSGAATQPAIFDMVDNFDGLRCIDSFLEEYRRAGSAGGGNGKEKPSFRFRLVDEARDSRRLFEQLGRCLASSWEACFREAEAYHAEHGNLRVPKRYITGDGIALGSWLVTQRRVRAGAVAGCLSEEQIERLDRLGMVWDSRIGKAWETGYRELSKFYEGNGHVDVPYRYMTEDGYPLGRFVSNQRAAWKNGREAEEKIRQLDALGFIWEKTGQSWDRYYGEARAFYQREGHLDIPVKYVTEDGLQLGVWISAKRCGREQLSAERIAALDKIGMNWDTYSQGRWRRNYSLAKKFYLENGHLDVPVQYVVEGVSLGRWVSRMRESRIQGAGIPLTEGQIRELDEIGMIWKTSWDVRFEAAREYYEGHGNLRVPQTYVTENRIWLGKWLREQKRKRGAPGRRGLTEGQIRKLESIGMDWD